MHSGFKRDLDPLDLELLERAWVAVKENSALVDLDSDEELEATLRRELVEIACSNGVTDAETLRDVLLAALSVGDDAEADVAGALRAGLGGAVLVRTGKYCRGDEARFDPRPTVTVESLSAAVDWILAHRPSPPSC